jgi:hypothetical protein
MDKVSFRNVWVSLAIMLPFGTAGLFIFRNHPEAKGMLELVLLFCVIGLRHFLDRHELDGDKGD